jgi:nitrite reductase (NADH) large subunit
VEHGKVAGQEMAGKRTEYRGSLNMNVTQMFGATVASMGRFAEEGSGVRVWERYQPEEVRCVRILTRDSVPVGASVIGQSGDAALLGRLRPFVRLGRPLPAPETLLSGAAIVGPLSRPGRRQSA